jgi:hypothetical protein
LLKKIVAGSAPSPFTLIALLNQMKLPSAIGVALKLSSIALNSVHDPALKAEDDSLGSEERSDTTEVDPFTATLFTALVTALFTALVTALFRKPPNARKLPLARDTRAKPNAREKIPSPIRHLRAPTESAGALNSDSPERASRERRVSIMCLPLFDYRGNYGRGRSFASIALWSKMTSPCCAVTLLGGIR